ncbi:hypothetical protein [uncultured Massilia sp.]|uniref:hypothetical protein n=1 Tax=uncultured Massilia sp. TaxID=169973 RepID=UPI0025F6EFC3|nr:hypothetical protein [uncultured Massilia sp.]
MPAWIDLVKIDEALVDKDVEGADCARNCATLCLGHGACGACGKRRHSRPAVPLAAQRFQSAASAGGRRIPAMQPVDRSAPARFYCQNPNQSGDTTGVGMALAIFPDMNLLFFASVNAPGQAAAFLTYYQDMGAVPKRVLLLVGDTEVVPQPKPTDKEQKEEKERKRKALADIAQQRKGLNAQVAEWRRQETPLLTALGFADYPPSPTTLATIAKNETPDGANAKLLIELRANRRKAARSLDQLALQEAAENPGNETVAANKVDESLKDFTIESVKGEVVVEKAASQDEKDEKDEKDGKTPVQADDGAAEDGAVEDGAAQDVVVSEAPPALDWKDIALADMSIDMLVRLLRWAGWPVLPLYAPSILIPSRLNVDKVPKWLCVDPSTALDTIDSEIADLDQEFHDAEVTLAVLPGWLDEKALSPDPLVPRLAQEIGREELERIRAMLRKAPGRIAEQREALRQPELLSALHAGTERSGVRLPELLGQLRVAQVYKLFCYESPDKKRQLLVLARTERDLKQAHAALELPADGTWVDLREKARIKAPVEKSRNRFNAARELLLLKLSRRDEKAKRFARIDSVPADVMSKVSKLAGHVLPWNYFEELAGNQLYQGLTALAIRLRDAQITVPADKASGFQTLMRIPDHQYYPIGDTSRHILAVLQRQGARELTRRIAERLAPGCEIVQPALQAHFKKFVTDMTEKAGIKRLVFVLIWVRGVNGAEMGKLAAGLKAGFQATIGDGSLRALDSLKRNPHHVMTAQLCTQLQVLFDNFNQGGAVIPSPDPKRYFVPIPIGDPVYIDQYDHASELVFGEDADNMINLWNRENLPGLKTAIGGPHWRYRQVAMMRELFMDGRFDLMQIGIRSGAIEQGMYQLVPSIYIEEHMCSTGDRMASLTREGPGRAVLDQALRKIQDRIAGDIASASAEPKDVSAKSAKAKSGDAPSLSLEEEADVRAQKLVVAKGELAALLAFREACDSVLVGKDPEAVQNWIAAHSMYETLVGECVVPEQLLEGIGNALGDKEPAASSAVPPEPDPACGGFPLFFRLVTNHLVGLNQARTRENLATFRARLLRKLAPTAEELPAPDDEQQRVERGALQFSELALLREYVKIICDKYDTVRATVHK